jgi:hypothetical protein
MDAIMDGVVDTGFLSRISMVEDISLARNIFSKETKPELQSRCFVFLKLLLEENYYKFIHVLTHLIIT